MKYVHSLVQCIRETESLVIYMLLIGSRLYKFKLKHGLIHKLAELPDTHNTRNKDENKKAFDKITKT